MKLVAEYPIRLRIPTRHTWRVRALRLSAFASLLLAMACGEGSTAFERATEARRSVAALQVQFSAAVDASNRAVLADTDPLSTQFAEEAQRERDEVKGSSHTLSSNLQALGFADAVALLAEFDGKFAAYEVLDRDILGLAVENTNLKAERIAFGAAKEAADAYGAVLRAVAAKLPAGQAERARPELLASLLAVREIEVLQAPHIAEADAAVMTRVEQQMAALTAQARDGFTRFNEVVGLAPLAEAAAALDRFLDFNTQIVALSRRNTNVRSLALTLGQKRILVATCEESLRALNDALAHRLRGPTR